MDGNGRWATRRFLPRVAGHKKGVDALRACVRHCGERGVKVLTVFAFSSENWNRPAEEVSGLMELLAVALAREVPQLNAEGVRIHFVGDRARAVGQGARRPGAGRGGDRRQHAPGVQRLLQLRRPLGHRPGRGAGWPRAASRSPSRASTGAMALAHVPDPDLLIRTGGEQRISNFLLWQAAYAELYFSDKLWPEFDAAALDEAIADYASARAPLRQDLRAGRARAPSKAA